MSETIIYRNVWLQNDTQAESDAVAAWKAAGVATSDEDTAVRLKQLCIVAYAGDQLAAISTTFIRYSQVVRENMAFLRVFVAKGHREKGIVNPLTYATHDAMSAYALANPHMKIGGTMGVVASHGQLDRPVLGAEMVLIGYTPENDPLLVRWFKHTRIDEEAARLRTPERMRRSQIAHS